ncbi:MAG TPA: MMPL family transporter [Ktedonobacteraceae bacterium]
MQIREESKDHHVNIPESEHRKHEEEEVNTKIEKHALYRWGLVYGRQVHRFRWPILAFWVIAVVVSVPFITKVGSVLQSGGYSYSGSEAAHASNIISSKLRPTPTQLLVVFQSANTGVNAPDYRQEVNNFINKVHAFPHVSGAVQSGPGQDGRTTFVTVTFSVNSSTVKDQLDDFQKLLPGGTSAIPAHAYVTGDPAISKDFSQITQQDTEQAEFFALPIALLVLLVVFGTLLAALTPLVLAMVAVPVALALIYVIALHADMSIFVLNVASVIGLGISIDYSLFMTRRFRDELANGRDVREAVAWTIATSGEAILFSGMIVMIGFCGLLLIGIPFMTSFGVGGAVVVAASVLAALTLLPALLGVLGYRINALRVPFLSRFTMDVRHSTTVSRAEVPNEERGGFWQKWALAVMRRPMLIIVVVTAILIGLGWPIFSLNIGTPSVTALPASAGSRKGIDILNAQFPETNENPIFVIVQAPGGSSILTSGNLSKLDSLSRWLASRPHVTGVVSLTHLSASPGPLTLTEQQLATLYSSGAYQQNSALSQLVSSTTKGDTTLITVKSNTIMDSSDGKALINDLRAGDKAAGQGLTVLVGGDQADSMDFSNYLYGNFPRAILFILAVTYILLLLMFRSVLLPLKAILMNVLSLSACFGVLVFIFQWGNFSNVLHFTSEGSLDSTIPILLFCILFGLSMDYEVFLLSRIQEEWLRTHDNRRAVARGLEKTGSVITNAALLFMIVAGAFIFTSILLIQEMGIGLTVAVLVDAAIIRMLLVPATMRLLGRWNWWLPGRPLLQKQ